MNTRSLLAGLLGTAALLVTQELAAQTTAEYTLTFTSTWSAATHPMDFPPSPHYSALRGVTHNSSVSFWAAGTLASEGIKQMAETGNNSGVNSEITTAKTAGTAENDIFGSGLSPSPGSIMTSVSISDAFPLVSVVAMLAPSPDWFIGLNGVDLFNGGSWVGDTLFTLYAYDAGTDSGSSYGSPNEPSDPAVNIFQISDGPFFVNNVVEPVGTIRFELDTSLAIELPELEQSTDFIAGPYPNPAGTQTSIELNVDRVRGVEVAVFDLLGRRVMGVHDGPLASGKTRLSIDTSALAAGIYLLRVLSGADSSVRVLSIVR